MNIGRTSSATRCPRCLRSRTEIIADHVRSGETCACADCPFREDIRQALLQASKPSITFGPTRSPSITFGPVRKPSPADDARKGEAFSFGKTRLGRALRDLFD